MATKIAQVTSGSTSLTGVDRHVASLAAKPAELGFAITVVTDAPGYLTQACEQLGILRRCPSTDVLIVSSRSETGPIVVLEAMSRGILVVAAEVGELTGMLPDRRYGRIAPVHSVAAFADAICILPA